MPDWSPSVANRFIALAKNQGSALTQMQLQKLVYIAHGWNLAISGHKLTFDDPEAWDYGPVYKELRRALRKYGRDQVTEKIRNADFLVGLFAEAGSAFAEARLSGEEDAVVARVYKDYGHFHAFQLSALTHKDKTPWSDVYKNGEGRFSVIPNELIRSHFVELARKPRESE